MSNSQDGPFFELQPFGAVPIIAQDNTNGRFKIQLDVDGRTGLLPRNLIPRSVRNLKIGDLCPVLIHKLRPGRDPLLIHADHFVLTHENPAAVFTQLLQHEHPLIRYQTCLVLRNVDNYRIAIGPLVTALTGVLGDRDPLVRWYATHAIDQVVIPCEEPLPAILEGLLTDPADLVRQMLGDLLLSWLGEESAPVTLAQQVAPLLPRLLRDRNVRIRAFAFDIQEVLGLRQADQAPSLDELLRGTGPSATPAVSPDIIASWINEFSSHDFLRHDLAGKRLVLAGPAATPQVAAAIFQTTDEDFLGRLLALLLPIGLSAPETIPLLVWTSVMDQRIKPRTWAADSLVMLLSHEQLGQELAARAVRLMQQDVTDPPWWCDPSQDLRLSPQQTIAGLNRLLCESSGRPQVMSMAIMALGMLDQAPVQAAHTLLTTQAATRSAVWQLRPDVQASLVRLQPGLAQAAWSIADPISASLPEKEIEWRFKLLRHAGEPGYSALWRLSRRFSLPLDLLHKINMEIYQQDLYRPSGSEADSLPTTPAGWIGLVFIVIVLTCLIGGCLLSWFF